MKSTKILTLVFLVSIATVANAQLKLDSYGYTTIRGGHWTGGIKVKDVSFSGHSMASIYPNSGWYGTLGTQSNYFGGAYIHHIWSAIYDTWPSDARAKENVKSLDKATDKIKLLNPVKYDIKDSFYDSIPEEARKEIMKNSKNKLGFIAQEVMEVFPEVVHQEPETGYYGISTMDLIPVLVQAIKEQQFEIESLKSEIKKGNGNLKSAQISTDEIKTIDGYLLQNTPNPFSNQTEIGYFIEESNSASIMIFDLQGTLIKTIPIQNFGQGTITISNSDLKAGMYLYTLVSNGVEIDTKRMILNN